MKVPCKSEQAHSQYTLSIIGGKWKMDSFMKLNKYNYCKSVITLIKLGGQNPFYILLYRILL